MLGVGLPSWHNCKESTYQCRSCKRHGFDLWVKKIPWRRIWPPIPVFLPGKFPGWRNLACHSPWDCRESDLTEHTPDVFWQRFSTLFISYIIYCCFCLVTKSCLTLCNPMDCSSQAPLSFTISQSLLRLLSIELVVLSIHLILCCSLLFLPSVFPRIRVFSSASALWFWWSLSIGASAIASILPMNLQSLFPLGLTALISLDSPRNSQESSPALQFEGINSFSLSLLYYLTLTSIHDYWKNYSFDYTDLCWQTDVSAF